MIPPRVLPALLALLALGFASAAQAGTPRLCDAGVELSAAQQDRRLQFAAAIKAELEASGQRVALLSRSGVDLARFGMRYSHAGVSLRASPLTPWSVRQLYYACDERQPRLFDQGLAGFLLAADAAPQAHVSVLFLPAEAAAALERAVLDTPLALQLLGPRYSANAYPFSTRYQNCNQWVAEMLAAAWGALAVPTRSAAQQWLREQAYAPTRFELGSQFLLWLARFVPLLHSDDHPQADLDQASLQVSMPAALEAFVRAQQREVRRVEFCHDEHQLVVREGWEPLGPQCTPGPGDRVLALQGGGLP